MSYKEFIENILNTRGRFACGDEYHERHHIVPRCMGGTDDEENLIDLFAREHFEAHRLLALENPDNNSLIYAWWMMAHCIRNKYGNIVRECISAEEYEEARKAFVYAKIDKPLKKETKKKISESLKGHILSEETRKKISESNKGKILSEEARKNMSEARKGEKHYLYGKHRSDETKRKLSVAHKGKYKKEDNPNYGRKHSDEAKKKMSEAAKGRKTSDETKRKLSIASSGRKHTLDTKEKISDINGISIRCIETNEIYRSMTHAENETKISRKMISKSCYDNTKTAGGFHWEFIDNHKFQNKNENNNFFGKQHSEEVKMKIAKMNSKSVRCIETQITYDSSKIAQEKTGIGASQIGRVCNGKAKTAGGYHWEFVEKEN